MKTSTLMKLVELNLSAEQLAGVVALIAEELAPLEKIRLAAAQRQAQQRSRVSCETEASRDSHVTPSRDSNVTAEKEKVSHTLPKENTSTLTGFGVRERAREAETDFERFWATYPKREGNRDRKAAEKAFAAAARRNTAAEIITGAARYAAHCDATGKTGTQYVRQARTWLNADGWTEEYQNAAPSKPLNSRHDRIDAALRVIDEKMGLRGGPAGQ